MRRETYYLVRGQDGTNHACTHALAKGYAHGMKFYLVDCRGWARGKGPQNYWGTLSTDPVDAVDCLACLGGVMHQYPRFL